MMRIVKGGMQPADGFAQERLRARGYKIGDLVSITVKKTRKPWYHRMAHKLCGVVGVNVERFAPFVSPTTGKADAHKVLKCIQWEADICCDHMAMMVPNVGMVQVRIPESISFESMEQGEFEEVYNSICQWVSTNYWPDLKPEQIEQMVSFMPEGD